MAGRQGMNAGRNAGRRADRGRRTSGARRHPALAFVLAAVVAAPVLLLVTADEAEAATTRHLVITSATARPTVPYGAFDGTHPKVFDFDGDGDQEIIAQNDNQWVYVFDSRTGGLLAELKTVFPSGWGARSMNAPEAAVVSGDGKTHLIVGNSAATITSYTFDPVGSTGVKFLFKKDWERRLTDCYGNPGMDSKPVLHDLDKDGVLEVIATTEESGVYALRATTGAIYWKKCIGGGNADASVGDLNQDSWPDVVFGSDGGIVTAMNGRTGGTMWTFNVKTRFGLGSGSIPVGPAIGQLDGVGGPDVVVGARDSHDATNFENNHAVLAAISSTGSLLWGKQDTAAGNPLTYTHPVIVDADKSGNNEVYWADWNTQGHKPGNWEVTGPANFYRYDKSGNMVWRTSMGTFWNNKDISLADVDADGVQEVLANGPGSNGHDGIWYLDSRTGAKETFIDVYPYKVTRAPIITDLYDNGRMYWVMQVSSFASGSGGAFGILVYDTGSPYNSAWPHLPYPSRGSGTPGPTTTTSTTTTTTSSGGTTTGGAFQAPFTEVRGNGYWVQANVGTNGPAISKVDVTLDRGATWKPLSKQSWGPTAWAASYAIPQGTVLQLRATAVDGQTDLSSCRQWIPPSGQDALIVPCPASTSTTTTGSGTFSASFSPRSVGNDWWVETGVSANQPIAKVEAKVNGGAYTVLNPTDWGTWAKSINAPNGSQVTFRATSSGGSVATSAPVTWT